MSEYEGGQCQQKYMTPMSFEVPKPNYTIKFLNAENEEVGTLDFNGPGLTFEGNAEQGAIVFIDWMAKKFKERLDAEYQRGFNEGKKHETNI